MVIVSYILKQEKKVFITQTLKLLEKVLTLEIALTDVVFNLVSQRPMSTEYERSQTLMGHWQQSGRDFSRDSDFILQRTNRSAC